MHGIITNHERMIYKSLQESTVTAWQSGNHARRQPRPTFNIACLGQLANDRLRKQLWIKTGADPAPTGCPALQAHNVTIYSIPSPYWKSKQSGPGHIQPILDADQETGSLLFASKQSSNSSIPVEFRTADNVAASRYQLHATASRKPHTAVASSGR